MSSLTTYTIEIAAGTKAEGPRHLPVEPRDYLLRLATDKSYSHGRFAWTRELRDDLGSLAQPDSDPGVARRVGETLRTFLDKMAGWIRVEDALERDLRVGGQVQLVFRFDASELYHLPWELLPLRATGQALGEVIPCHICYEHIKATVAPRAAPTAKGRILLAWSGNVPADRHAEALAAATTGAGDIFLRSRDVLSGLSPTALADELNNRHKPPVIALHLLCHGGMATSGVCGLLWNPVGGASPDFIDEGLLGRLLAPYSSTLRLVVLSACRSGDTSDPDSPLGGLGQALHRLGIPAVICSRFPLSGQGSIQLTQALYAGLLQRAESIQIALANARKQLHITRGRLDWATLQLYAHTEGLPEIRLLPSESQHHESFHPVEGTAEELPSGSCSVVLLEKGPANWKQLRESVARHHQPFDEALRSALDHPPALLGERLTYDEALSWLRELKSLGARATVYEHTGHVEAPRFFVSPSRIAWVRPPPSLPGSDAPSPFSLMVYPVEQALYQAVMGTNPSRIQAPDLPVTGITWDDARQFCERLTRREGLAGEPYRLPTEREWAYAACAGQSFEYAGSNDWREVAWCGMPRAAPVGKGRAPNGWGLFDMSGNVWERVEEPRVVCGGSFRSLPADAGLRSRRASDPAEASDEIGFRVARTQEVIP